MPLAQILSEGQAKEGLALAGPSTHHRIIRDACALVTSFPPVIL